MIQEEEERKVEERLKRQLKEIHQNYEEVEKTIVGLESQIVKSKKIVEDLTSQLQEKKESCQRKEFEILSLKEDLDKIVSQLETNSKFEKSSMILNDIISCQISPLDETDIGYNDKYKSIKEG